MGAKRLKNVPKHRAGQQKFIKLTVVATNQSDTSTPANAPSGKSLDQTAAMGLVLERTGLLLAGLGFALLAVKVTRVSHLNAATSLALLESAGPLDVVIGSFVAHLPLVVFVISAIVLWWVAGSFVSLRAVNPGHMGAAGVLLFALLLLPWPFLLVLLVVGTFRFQRSRSIDAVVDTAAARRKRRGYIVLASVAAIVLIADSSMWLPPEILETGEGTVVGYALSEPSNSGAWIVVLKHDTREIVHLRQSEVNERHACRLAGESRLELEGFPSLLQLALREDPDLPEPLCEE